MDTKLLGHGEATARIERHFAQIFDNNAWYALETITQPMLEVEENFLQSVDEKIVNFARELWKKRYGEKVIEKNP